MKVYIRHCCLTILATNMFKTLHCLPYNKIIYQRTNNFRSLSTSSSFVHSENKTVSVSVKSELHFYGDLLVIPILKPINQLTKSRENDYVKSMKASLPRMPESIRTVVNEILDENIFSADAGSRYLIRTHGRINDIRYVALVGLGSELNKKSAAKSFTILGRVVAGVAKEIKAQTVGILLTDGNYDVDFPSLILGARDSLYEDNRFKRKIKESGLPSLEWKSLSLLGVDDSLVKYATESIHRAEAIAEGVKFAKDLVGAPACNKTPIVIANEARIMAAEYDMEVKVLGLDECKALNMGAYLGVQQGSRFPPQFIHLTYRSPPSLPSSSLHSEEQSAVVTKVALVGKGLTFDSGGYNLKVGAGSAIELMKIDMGGCAAILGCARTIAALKPQGLEIHFLSAVCENMISAEAVRPGDILTASNGKTIEVVNTDAEGRLTLADALVYANRLKVDTIIDLATLTGACIVGLGEKVAALYSPDDSLCCDLVHAAHCSNEKVWHMPLEEEYREEIKSSKLADLRNLGAGKGGGSITAALFLQEFIGEQPSTSTTATTTPQWAHIDMAGPVWEKDQATGFGVKTLVNYLLNKAIK